MDQRSLNRRSFIMLGPKAAGALAAAALLSACGGTAAPSPSASGAPATSPSQSGAPAKPLKVAYVVVAATQSPVWMADATGAFAKRGVNVDLQYVESTVALKSLVAKEIDVVLQSATALITADLNGQADLVYIGSNSNHSQGELLSAASIKTAADLKGKLVGTDKPGSTIDYYNQVAFKLLGIQPSEVQVRPLGSSDVLLQALLSGQIQAASITPPQSLQAEAKGFNVLQNTYSRPYQGNGPIILRSRLNELSAALIPFLGGLHDGIAAFNNQPDLAKQTIAKYAKIADPDVLQRTYDFHKSSNPFQLDLKPTFEGIQAMLDFLAATQLPAAKNAKPEQFCDLSLLPKVPGLS